MCNIHKNKMFKIHIWAYKVSPDSFSLHLLPSGSSKSEKTVVTSENFDGKLFKNASSRKILKFLTGT